jgi:hypothetical protein
MAIIRHDINSIEYKSQAKPSQLLAFEPLLEKHL